MAHQRRQEHQIKGDGTAKGAASENVDDYDIDEGNGMNDVSEDVVESTKRPIIGHFVDSSTNI